VEEVDPTRISWTQVLDQDLQLRLQTLYFAVNVGRAQQRQAEILPKNVSDFLLQR
jgi:hypothetical protein